MEVWKIKYIFPVNKRKGRINDSFVVPAEIAATKEDVINHFKSIKTFQGTATSEGPAEILLIEKIKL